MTEFGTALNVNVISGSTRKGHTGLPDQRQPSLRRERLGGGLHLEGQNRLCHHGANLVDEICL